MANAQPDNRLGRYVETPVAGEVVRAFVPSPLPPVPPIDMSALAEPLCAACHALGRLEGAAALLPQRDLFAHMQVRREAVLSSRIEGLRTTLADLLRFEMEAGDGEPGDDLREVSNCVDATAHGLESLETRPLSLRLFRETHGLLMRSGRGKTKGPGEFRRSQNWIGGSRPGNALFVPPPAAELDACLGALERFVHEEESGLPVLVKAGLIHAQFETIHPFLDGNGRVGRLLVTLYLAARGMLGQPLLPLSLFLMAHRADYYRLLQEVRMHGAWEAWLDFFLEGAAETAGQAFRSAVRIAELFEADRERIAAGRARTGSAARVHECFQRSPFLTSARLAGMTGLSVPTVNAAIADLEGMGLLREVTGRRRGRVYCYGEYFDILGEGTDPLPAGG